MPLWGNSVVEVITESLLFHVGAHLHSTDS